MMEYVAQYGIRKSRDLPSNSTSIIINGVVVDRINHKNEEAFRREARRVNERTKTPRKNDYQTNNTRREYPDDGHVQLVC